MQFNISESLLKSNVYPIPYSKKDVEFIPTKRVKYTPIRIYAIWGKIRLEELARKAGQILLMKRCGSRLVA